MSRALSALAFRDALQQALQSRGWRDRGAELADALLVAVSVQRPRDWRELDLESVVPADFYIANHATPSGLVSLLGDRVGEVPEVIFDDADLEIVTIDDIDSFAAVRDVAAADVKDYAQPLRVNERVIKHCIHRVLDDPYIDDDHGGERADIVSDRLVFRGRRTLSAFMLKGPSVLGPLYGSKAGRRGDQVVRLLEVRAELSVIQHVADIPSETFDQLRYGVIALRTAGVSGATACKCDGVDTARLLRAYGYLNDDGSQTDVAKRADNELRRQPKSS
jgi:hypothetical protein